VRPLDRVIWRYGFRRCHIAAAWCLESLRDLRCQPAAVSAFFQVGMGAEGDRIMLKAYRTLIPERIRPVNQRMLQQLRNFNCSPKVRSILSMASGCEFSHCKPSFHL
jgi:hypothetical protein